VAATRRSRLIVLGFFVNPLESAVHRLVAPNATFIRMNFLRPRCGWNGARFARVLDRLDALTDGRPVEAVVWGYRDLLNYGVDMSAHFERCWRFERALIEPPLAAGSAFVVGWRSIYFDGRSSTDLERNLNALTPGRLPQSPDGRRLLSRILDASLSKSPGSATATARPTGRDLLIVGQCAGDQAITYTHALAHDNPGLLDLVAKHLLAGERAFDRVYFKPHPKSRTNAADLAYVRDRYPRIEIVDGGAGIASVLADRPTVATLTSGAGLEAAVRVCTVHTFGVPFYSHWGFTVDHMQVPGLPERRANRLSAADVLLYAVMRHTRYVDPRTGRPMSAMEAFGLAPAR
jgi:capsular polysaccharide export protein